MPHEIRLDLELRWGDHSLLRLDPCLIFDAMRERNGNGVKKERGEGIWRGEMHYRKRVEACKG